MGKQRHDSNVHFVQQTKLMVPVHQGLAFQMHFITCKPMYRIPFLLFSSNFLYLLFLHSGPTAGFRRLDNAAVQKLFTKGMGYRQTAWEFISSWPRIELKNRKCRWGSCYFTTVEKKTCRKLKIQTEKNVKDIHKA